MKNIKIINTLFSVFLFISISISSYAQLQNSHWYFGDKAGLKFNKEASTPSVLSDNFLMQTNGGSASISDNEGNLLFYTDGITVWNRNHEVMPNGSGLFGSNTVSQSVIIVPKEEDQYYIFTNQAHDLDSHGLSYSIVNMTGDLDDSGGNDNSDDDDYEYCNNNQSKIYICHEGNTICVNINAKDAHLAHGDSLGKCDDDDDDDNQDNDNDDDVSSSSGSKLKTGVIAGVTSDWKTVSLSRTYNSMVVIATPNYTLASVDPMVVRIRNASGNSFQVRADSPGGTVSPIDVHYMVVEEGVYEGMEAVKYNSTVTDQNNSWVGETRSYQNSYTNPVVLGQVMTYNDEGFSTFWACGNSRANPPSAAKLKTGKSVAEDKDVTRNDETIGYIVIESGSGNIDGISYSAALGSDIITHAEKKYTIDHSNAEVAIATISAMDGANGGWAVLSSAEPVSDTSLKLSIDEDIIGDKETAHTTEQVAYVVFSNKDSNSNDDEDDNDEFYDDDDDHDHGNSELGYVVSGSKNTQLLPFTSEKLTVIANPNDDSYWVVSFAPSVNHKVSDTFYTFKVDENGVTLFNESTFAFPFAPNTEYTGGQMKISPDATALAIAHNTVDRHDRYGIQNYTSLFSFEFDSTTGKVSAYNQEFIANDLNFYGIEFSPNSKLLYVTGTHIMSDANKYPVKEKEVGRLYQIPFRQTSQDNMGESLYEGTRPLFGLQLGSDEKIYVVNASGNLSVINSPNTEGFDANFEFEKIDLTGKARRELPQAVPEIPEKADRATIGKSYEILENPVKFNFKIKFTAKDSYTIEFYSSMGVNIKHISFKGAEKNKLYEVRAEDLTPGIYFLTIKDTKSNVWEETIIKQ